MNYNMIVTGGFGFIGSNFIRDMIVRYPGIKIFNIDKCSYAANPGNLPSNITTYLWDLADNDNIKNLINLIDNVEPMWIIHFAAESHVDNSISAPQTFLHNNVQGTLNLLEAMRLSKFRSNLFHISTDEVYGSLSLYSNVENKPSFLEHDQFEPSSPYAASKAAAEMFVIAYGKTYQIPYIITRCSNNYGPRQHFEKFIPKVITYALQGLPIPVYGTGVNKRDWIHVFDNISAIDFLLNNGMIGEVYNIGTGTPSISNLQVVDEILRLIENPKLEIHHVPDRLGHDLNYQNDTFKLTCLGWKPLIDFEFGLKDTIEWYKNNIWFWRK